MSERMKTEQELYDIWFDDFHVAMAHKAYWMGEFNRANCSDDVHEADRKQIKRALDIWSARASTLRILGQRAGWC